MESDHGSRSSKHPRIREEASTVNSVDSEHSGGSRTSSETTRSEAIAPSTTGNYKSSDSLPSSSTEFYSDDFLQVDPLINPVSSATDDHKKSQENTKPPLRDGKYDVHSGPLFQIEEIFGSSSSASQFSEVTHESFIPSLSPTQSPPIQVMERGRGYDPDRIPASVFTKPSSPRDWSVASNESLFSIRIGNNSFSRDRNEIGKSGELDKSSELYRSGELKNSSELISFRQNSPVKRGGEHKIRNFDLGKTGAFEKTKESHPNRTIRDEERRRLQSLHAFVQVLVANSALVCGRAAQVALVSFQAALVSGQAVQAALVSVQVFQAALLSVQARVAAVKGQAARVAAVNGQDARVAVVSGQTARVAVVNGQTARVAVVNGQAALVSCRAVRIAFVSGQSAQVAAVNGQAALVSCQAARVAVVNGQAAQAAVVKGHVALATVIASVRAGQAAIVGVQAVLAAGVSVRPEPLEL
ncbi:hypothetical protein ACH5RR_035960 [Cinchona calisaya]|uniref:Uncharacterized protein n=1 Tax=Cinchona calisaya TaxID=153742 RepID=A0ABD2Y3C0_9GENT